MTKDLGMGGTQRVAQNVAIETAKLGVETAVFAWSALGPRAENLARNGIQIFSGLSEREEVLASICRWTPDLIHIHRTGYFDEEEYRLIRFFKARGIRVIETNVFARFDKKTSELIDYHLLLTRWCMVKWVRWSAGVKAHLAAIVPNPVETQAFRRLSASQRDSIRMRLGIPDGRIMFGRVGQPIHSKWSARVFNVFESTAASGRDVGLLLIGAPSQYQAIVKDLPYEIRKRIILLDPVENDSDLNQIYNALDIFLHMSAIGESFGMVLCEAMLCEVPVLTLSTFLKDNSQLEVVGHGQGGYTASNEPILISLMHILCDRKELRETLGRQGRAKVLTQYDSYSVAHRLRQIYQRVVNPEDCSVELSLSPLPAGSDADGRWMEDLMRSASGKNPKTADLIAFQLVHTPVVYMVYQLVTRFGQLIGKKDA